MIKYIEAMKVAESLLEQFRPGCERIEIQGALRRLERGVNEINLLAVPRLQVRFETCMVDGICYLEQLLDGMRDNNVIQYDKVNARSKRFYLLDPLISVQLYLVLPPATWGVRYVFGTGPEHYLMWLLKRQKYGGALPNHLKVKDGAVWDRETGAKYDTPEEVDFYKLCGLDWVAPQERR